MIAATAHDRANAASDGRPASASRPMKDGTAPVDTDAADPSGGNRSDATASSNNDQKTALTVQRLRNRADFLRAARAAKRVTPAFILQIRDRHDGDTTVRAGFTCSRKVGNAVTRNRAKRRLREAARLILPHAARPGHDYVLIGRADVTVRYPFDRMMADLAAALE